MQTTTLEVRGQFDGLDHLEVEKQLLILLNWASSLAGLMVSTVAIAAASGILLPVLGFWTSLAAGPMQGGS